MQSITVMWHVTNLFCRRHKSEFTCKGIMLFKKLKVKDYAEVMSVFLQIIFLLWHQGSNPVIILPLSYIPSKTFLKVGLAKVFKETQEAESGLNTE